MRRCLAAIAHGSSWHIPAVATTAKDGRSRLESGRRRSAARWLPEREVGENTRLRRHRLIRATDCA